MKNSSAGFKHGGTGSHARVSGNEMARVLFAAILLSYVLHGETMRLSVEGARPLGEALQELAKRHGWPLCYEESVWPYDGDNKNKLAGYGAIDLTYDPGAGPERAVRGLVQAHHDRENPGRFEVIKSGNRWCAVIRERKDQQGRWQQVRSPLEGRVTLAKRRYGLYPLFDEMAAQLGPQAGVKFDISTGIYSNGIGQRSVEVEATAETGRDVLERAIRTCHHPLLQAAGLEVDWYLYCDSGTLCFANIRSYRPDPRSPPPPPFPPKND